MKQLLKDCYICGQKDSIELQKTEEFIRVGKNVTSIEVSAEICNHCGEKYFDVTTVRRFEKIRKEMKNKKSKELIPVGIYFKTAS